MLAWRDCDVNCAVQYRAQRMLSVCLIGPTHSGTSFINESKLIESLSDHFVGFEAPRTALGVFKNGSVILAEVCVHA